MFLASILHACPMSYLGEASILTSRLLTIRTSESFLAGLYRDLSLSLSLSYTRLHVRTHNNYLVPNLIPGRRVRPSVLPSVPFVCVGRKVGERLFGFQTILRRQSRLDKTIGSLAPSSFFFYVLIVFLLFFFFVLLSSSSTSSSSSSSSPSYIPSPLPPPST